MSTNFGDRLTEANRRTGSVLCMGIDPHCQMIPALFGNAAAEAGSPSALGGRNPPSRRTVGAAGRTQG